MAVNNGTVIEVKFGTFPGKVYTYYMQTGQTVRDLIEEGKKDGVNVTGYTIKVEGEIVSPDAPLEDGLSYYGMKDLKGN